MLSQEPNWAAQGQGKCLFPTPPASHRDADSQATLAGASNIASTLEPKSSLCPNHHQFIIPVSWNAQCGCNATVHHPPCQCRAFVSIRACVWLYLQIQSFPKASGKLPMPAIHMPGKKRQRGLHLDPGYIYVMTPSSRSSTQHQIAANIYWAFTVYKALNKYSKYAVFFNFCSNPGRYHYFLYRWGKWGLQKLICPQFPVTWHEIWTDITPRYSVPLLMYIDHIMCWTVCCSPSHYF